MARIVELGDASAISFLIQGLKSGDLDERDASAFVRSRAMRELRLMTFLAHTSRPTGSFNNEAIRPNALSGGAFTGGVSASPGPSPGTAVAGAGSGSSSPGRANLKSLNLDAGKGGALLDRREVDALLRELKQRDESIRHQREGQLGRLVHGPEKASSGEELGFSLPFYETWEEKDCFELGKVGSVVVASWDGSSFGQGDMLGILGNWRKNDFSPAVF